MLLFPAMSMLSVGGILLILTNMQVGSPGTLTPTWWQDSLPGTGELRWHMAVSRCQVGNLFGNYRSIIITLYNGAFDSSSAIFLIVKVGARDTAVVAGEDRAGNSWVTCTDILGTSSGTQLSHCWGHT